jgi:hypothetical protein
MVIKVYIHPKVSWRVGTVTLTYFVLGCDLSSPCFSVRGENLRSDLGWLCLEMVDPWSFLCWGHCQEIGPFPERKHRIQPCWLGQTSMVFVYCYFLGDIVSKNVLQSQRCHLNGWCYRCFESLIALVGSLFFSFLFSFIFGYVYSWYIDGV